MVTAEVALRASGWGRGSARRRPTGRARRIPAVGLALAALLAVWVVWRPPSPDLAAQVYRAHLFSLDGFAIWDNAWYGGHYLPGYSLIFPPLGSLLGVRLTGILAVSVSTLIFRALAGRLDGFAARSATMLFALSAVGDLFIGRVTFALGVTFGLATVLAAVRGWRICCGICSFACAAASPVAAAFLVMTAVADLAVNRARGRAALIAGPALCLVVGLVLLFPEGGYEPFALASLLAACGATVAVIALLPPADRLLRALAWTYLAGLLLAYLLPTPMGSNAVRFGVLFAPAVLAGRVRVADVQRAFLRVRAAVARRRPGGQRPIGLGRTPARWLLSLLSAAVVLWQLTGPIDQSVGAARDPAAHYAFYVPAIHYLESRSDGRPMRIEVPFTSSHWDATILGRRFLLARGWERQLDTQYDGLFYAPGLSATAYHAWLTDNAVRFVALSSATPDFSSVKEDVLIRAGLPFLRLVFQTADWWIYEVLDGSPLASGPGQLSAVDTYGFTLDAASSGDFLVRLHYTHFWTVTKGAARILPAPGDWTTVVAERSGPITIDAELPIDIDF
jgi:hypothetical protein